MWNRRWLLSRKPLIYDAIKGTHSLLYAFSYGLLTRSPPPSSSLVLPGEFCRILPLAAHLPLLRMCECGCAWHQPDKMLPIPYFFYASFTGEFFPPLSLFAPGTVVSRIRFAILSRVSPPGGYLRMRLHSLLSCSPLRFPSETVSCAVMSVPTLSGHEIGHRRRERELLHKRFQT